MPQADRQPVLGHAFNDVLMELHAHVFHGVPGESDPFVLTMLDREYIAFVLACYYQCEHCRAYHARAIERERRQGAFPIGTGRGAGARDPLPAHRPGGRLGGGVA